MRFRTTIVIGLLLLLGVAAFATSALQRSTSGANEDRNQSGLQLPITVKQLQPENGNSVDLQCGSANVTPPNILNGFECTLKNNTQKSITAANIIYSTVLQEGGRETKDSRNQILLTYFHPDFYDKESPEVSLTVKRLGNVQTTYDQKATVGIDCSHESVGTSAA